MSKKKSKRINSVNKPNTIIKINDVLYKKINKPFVNLTEDWFECYNSLYKNNDYLVKVIAIDESKNIIIMEDLGEVTSVEYFFKDGLLKQKIDKSLLCDIILALNKTWTLSIEYSKTLPDNKFFVHTDLHLDNIVITSDYKVKIIDPDAFAFVENLENTEKFYMSQIALMANLGIYYRG